MNLYLTSLYVFQPLLQVTKPLHKSALAVSTLIYSYCRENVECGYTSEVKTVVTLLEGMLGYDCSATADKEKIMMALKAIGNMGHAESLVPILNRCMTTGTTEIRVTAINAFRRMACTAEVNIPSLLYI